jgi:pimeloyl-ACP methyl ester carboxylesterase
MGDSSSGQGPLVLVHGTGTDSRHLQRLSQCLAGKAPVVLFDRPGWSGGEPSPSKGYFRVQGEALARRLTELGEACTVFGWSSGGIVALHAALIAPERFRRLVLYEPPLWASRDGDRFRMARFLEMLAWSGLRRPRRVRGAFWRMVTVRAEGATGFERLDGGTRSALLEHEGPLLHEVLAGTGEELRAEVGRLEVPTSVLVGGASAPLPHRAAQRLAEAAHGVVVQSIDGLDHLGPIASPERVAAALA